MASALVQMGAFSPSPPLALGADSLESFPGAGKRSLAQSHSDGDDEQGHAKKRRKQSKPVRIAAADSDDKAPDGRHYLAFAETGEHFLTEGLDADSPEDDSCGDGPHPRAGGNAYEATLPLNLSSIKSSFAESLVAPDDSDVHGSTNKHITVDIISQYQSGEDSKTPVPRDNSYLSQSPSLLMPLFKQTQIQSQISQITSQMRIFNPEAFCDLCNKEFCNKYFLKTHKANKHGIYTETQGGPSLLDPVPSMAFTNYFSTNNETYESPPAFQTAKPLLNQPSYLNVRSAPSAPKKAQPITQGTSVTSVKSNSNGNMRALCNICQREFCNKYFVRRHKLKIHGIVDPISKDGSNEAQENNSFNNNNPQVKTEMSSGDLDFLSGYVKPLPLSFNLDAKEELQNVETNGDKPNENAEKEQETERQVVTAYGFPMSSESSFFQVSQNEENNKENNMSSIKLKKFGVVNADAFCDICCKEYCNKYFLRTHKLKSHGIIPVEEKRDDTGGLNGASSNIPWYQLQSTPLNLIVGETTTNKSNPEKPSYDVDSEECVCGECGRYFQSKFLLKMHQAYTHVNKCMTFDSVPSSNNQNSKSFDVSKNNDVSDFEKSQEQSGLQNYSPVVKSEFLKEGEESDHKSIISPENVKKMQNLLLRLNNSSNRESSVCDVCEKDLGHISLVEGHILKEHSALLEEVGNMTEEDNSSIQSPHFLSTSIFKKECPHCQKVFYKFSALEQHIQEVHVDLEVVDSENIKKPSDFKDGNNSNKMSLMPYMTQSPEERQCLQTPASSFCEICKKELCNKYFMKTHMQRMHGISIENGAQIGGVVCDICNKELCSKYFLRVHKQNSHGIVDELFLPQLGLDFFRNQSPSTDSALKPSDQSDLSNRYFTHFNEVCPICNRRFRSIKWLKAHLWNDHGEEGKEKWKEVFLPTNLDPKLQQFDDNQKETQKPNTYPLLFNSSSEQLLNALSSSESVQNGKDTIERQGLSEKTLQNSTMFSMLMNGKDSESKHYQCSYCTFTTTILAFLFIHERSHNNARQYQPEQDQQLRCPVCFSSLDSKENFEKHLKLHKNAWHQPYNSNTSMQDQSGNLIKTPEAKRDYTTNKDIDFRSNQEINVTSPIANEERLQVSARSNRPAHAGESSMRCTRCGFSTGSVQEYYEHVNREHSDPHLQTDRDLPSYLQQVERALSTLASNAGIPAVFAVPRQRELLGPGASRPRDNVTMQPFVLEDSDYTGDTNNPIDPKPGKTFLSSLVFLPVKEKLKKSVTASFKLTPT